MPFKLHRPTRILFRNIRQLHESVSKIAPSVFSKTWIFLKTLDFLQKLGVAWKRIYFFDKVTGREAFRVVALFQNSCKHKRRKNAIWIRKRFRSGNYQESTYPFTSKSVRWIIETIDLKKKKKKRRRRKRKGKKRIRKMWNKNVPSFVRFPWRCRRAIRFSASCSYSIFFCLCILEFFFSLASLYTHTDGKNAHATERKGAQFRLFSLKLSKHIPICLLAFFRLLFFFRPPLYLSTPPFPTSAVACTFFPCNDESRIVIKLRGLFNFSLETLLILSSKPSRTKNLFFRYFIFETGSKILEIRLSQRYRQFSSSFSKNHGIIRFLALLSKMVRDLRSMRFSVFQTAYNLHNVK